MVQRSKLRNLVLLFALTFALVQCKPASSPPPGSICGDGICLPPDENCEFCPSDCGSCEDHGVMVGCGNDHLTVTLTFDDGPAGKTTLEILDVLDKYNISGTFFVIGEKLEDPENLAAMKRAAKEGHLIGSHTFTHPDLCTLKEQQVASELVKTSQAIYDALGYTPFYMRPPYGSINPTVEGVLKSLNLTPVLWNVDSNDWDLTNTPSKIVKAVEQQYSTCTGGIVNLMHDIYETSAQQLENVIKYYIGLGAKFVRLDHCASAPLVQANSTGPVVAIPTAAPTPTPVPLPITGTAIPVDALGRYCNSNSTFVYKSSANLPLKGLACPDNTVCLCAYTGELPCGHHGDEAELCPNSAFDAETHSIKTVPTPVPTPRPTPRPTVAATVTPVPTGGSTGLQPDSTVSPADSVFSTFGIVLVSVLSLGVASYLC
eukprot:GILJ01015338.1.p1 GENE.GILJ01015338.1~~GILJ01015338.1.p1  ORF type:complete len:430 (-),score=55.14 GILJ01015338.1:231-1520(-)